MKEDEEMWLLYAFGSAVAAGLTAVLAKIGVQGVKSNVATAFRTMVVLAFAWLMVLVTGGMAGIGEISPSTLLFLVLSGLATGASWLCYFKALQLGDVNKVAPIDKSSTVMTMLLACLILGEGLSALKILCMAAISLGTWLMIDKKPVSESGRTENGLWLLYALLSAFFASLTSILGKIGISHIDSNLGTAIRTIVVLIMAWIVVFVTGEQKDISHISRRSAIFLILSGISTGTSWLCYYRALQEGPASIVVPIDKLSILVTIAFSSIILKEKLSKKSIYGLLLIVVGTLTLLV